MSAHRPAASPRCCLANGASLVFSIDVGRDQLIPSLRGHPRIVSMEETDNPHFEGSGCRWRPDIVVIASVSSRERPCLRWRCRWRHRRCIAGIDKTQFEAARKHSKRGIIRNAMVHQEICDDIAAFVASHGCTASRCFHPRSAGARQHRILHRRAPWLNASSSTTSAIAATVSLTGGAPCTCRTRWRETSRWKLYRAIIPIAGVFYRSSAQAPSALRHFARIFAICAVARSSIGKAPLPRLETQHRVETLAQAKLDGEVYR